MVEKEGNKRIKLFRVNDRSKPTLEKYSVKFIHSDTKIHTDCLKEYTGLKHLFNEHSTVNHSKYFKDPITLVHTNTIEGNWFACKIHIPQRRRTTKKIDLYLVRFMILRNESVQPLKILLKYSF
ncbi:hypothetical protein NGRA_2060 [Nosema granulosis]|uniref:ISXO2-like transposase domain-containing protein n=1 Tax=Nosema granulosis TaxID=83296 RepID=A0A9P6GXQ4_9MICR|nr:hypothetical protein NGRA_2060 [Nosema granulosis]